MSITFVLYFVVPITLGVLILLAGGVLFLMDARKNKSGTVSGAEEWNETGGKILSARLEEHTVPDAESTYEPVVEYVYTAGEKEYHGNMVFPGASARMKKDAAQEILNKYPVNAYAPVRYNPQDPSASALEERPYQAVSRLRMAAQVLVAFGVLVCCFTSLMLFIIANGMSYVS